MSLDISPITLAFSHDPLRRSHRWPGGAVPCGTSVIIRLDVAPSVRDSIRQAWVEVLDETSAEHRQAAHDVQGTPQEQSFQTSHEHSNESGFWHRIPLTPTATGFEGVIDTSGIPRVVFYRFHLQTDRDEIFYGRRDDLRTTAGQVYVSPAHEPVENLACGFQLTIYDPAFTTPAWFSGSVMYQIFPDRFARGASGIRWEGAASHEKRGWPVKVHEDWDEEPDWREPYEPVDFFGGTLEGIGEHLDYLASLGVEVLYLNPVCEARSNHRYNTGDYEAIDPILGTWADFEALAAACQARGMRLVLDTVLSHTGSASRYFNADGSYDSLGAFQSLESPFRTWYDFTPMATGAPYRCWWGDPTLPEVREWDPSWQVYILGNDGDNHSGSAGITEAEGAGTKPEPVLCQGDVHSDTFDTAATETAHLACVTNRKCDTDHIPNTFANENSGVTPTLPATPSTGMPAGVLPTWLTHGTSGLRLDVADEIPDPVLETLRTRMKAVNPQTVIIGEVWEDATTKESYGARRTYALGRALDSVMNYPLRSALISFALGQTQADELVTFLKLQASNYPAPFYTSLMNLLSSHDVERVRTVLDLGEEIRQLPREDQVQKAAAITPEADAYGASLQKLLATILYLLPGVPCLYYGDEKGLQGGRDPFDRATFPWSGQRKDCGRDLTAFYQSLGQLRRKHPVLRQGDWAYYAYGNDGVGILRLSDSANAGPEVLFGVINRSATAKTFAFDLVADTSPLSEEARHLLRTTPGAPKLLFTSDTYPCAAEASGSSRNGDDSLHPGTLSDTDTPSGPRTSTSATIADAMPSGLCTSTASVHTTATCDDGIFCCTLEPFEARVYQLRAPLTQPLPSGVGVICHITSIPMPADTNNADSPDAGLAHTETNPDEANAPEVDSRNPNANPHHESGINSEFNHYTAPHDSAKKANTGPGTLGQPAQNFVDKLAEAGVRYWQLLPLNPTDAFGSPYAGLSAFAGNTRLLPPDIINTPLTSDDLSAFEAFKHKNQHWLFPYAAFKAIKELLGEKPWQTWPDPYRAWHEGMENLPELADAVTEELRRQYLFDREWTALRTYANNRGIAIIGDMPIYVSADSADVWAYPQFFALDSEDNVALQGGVPPDQMAADGQLWGSPTYNWPTLRTQNYSWWVDRFARMFELYDYIRIDHFIGLSGYYAIPAGKTAHEGFWTPGPGLDLFQQAYNRLGPLPIIAEDLGIVTPAVKQLLAQIGALGMDVIQFADGDPLTQWSPKPHTICYTGTHDTPTLVGWVHDRYTSDENEDEGVENGGATESSKGGDNKTSESKNGLEASNYFEADDNFATKRLIKAHEIADIFIENAVASSAPIIILPLQDVCALGNEARMNVPGVAEGNWSWQACEDDFVSHLQRLADICATRPVAR